MRVLARIIAPLLAAVLLLAGVSTASATTEAGGWEQVSLVSDGHACEFEPGTVTQYEIDPAFPDPYFLQRYTLQERPDGTMAALLLARPSGQELLYRKADTGAPGPDVVTVQMQYAMHYTGTADLEPISAVGVSISVVRTPDGSLVDRNVSLIRGIDENGEEIVVKSTGVCG